MKTLPVPPYDKLIVLEDPARDKTKSGIYLPGVKQDLKGTVIAVGPGKILPNGERVKPALVPGDRILYSEFGGQSVVVDGVKFLCMKEENCILALRILDENDPVDKAVSDEWDALVAAARTLAQAEYDAGG